jgi:hypothetical protein
MAEQLFWRFDVDVFFNTKEFHTMAAFIKIQKRNIPMYVRLYHWCFKCLSSFIRYIVEGGVKHHFSHY